MSIIKKKSPTDLEIHPLLANRWSPRIFDPESTIAKEDLVAILEAARVAPSAFNEQPWRYLVGLRSEETFTRILDGLSEFNREWCKNASALLLVCAVTKRENGNPIKTYKYDIGLSTSQATFEAHSRGYFTHHLVGFDSAKLIEIFALGELEPVVVIAIGKQGHIEGHSAEAVTRESSPSTRKSLSEIILRGLDS